MSDPFLLTQLAKLCSVETRQPDINRLVADAYRYLASIVLNAEFPRVVGKRETRMRAATERGVYEGTVIDPKTPVVTVDIARAGVLPSQVIFDFFCQVLDAGRIRQDHLFLSRVTDDSGRVTGVDVGGSKIGGDVQGRIVIFPDPMGATGGSLSRAVSIYKGEVQGTALKYIALNLIATPEFIRRMRKDHPDVVLYAARLDRGMSPDHVFDTIPGERWDEERGLTDTQYIVPGGGGFGELLNNAEY